MFQREFAEKTKSILGSITIFFSKIIQFILKNMATGQAHRGQYNMEQKLRMLGN
jgi:hypothetical protein